MFFFLISLTVGSTNSANYCPPGGCSMIVDTGATLINGMK